MLYYIAGGIGAAVVACGGYVAYKCFTGEERLMGQPIRCDGWRFGGNGEAAEKVVVNGEAAKTAA